MEQLLIPVNNKIEGLQREVKYLRSPRLCSFWGMFGNKIKCVYKDEWNYCQSIGIAPGNGDAWCAKQINKSLGGKFATD